MRKRKKRVKKKPTKVCGYCQFFYLSEDKEMIEAQRGRIKRYVQHRECSVTKSKVNKDTEACKKFQRAKYFWCKRENNWINMDVCLHRRKIEQEGCVRCRQGKYIEEVIYG